MYDIITIGGATGDIMFDTKEGVFINNSRDPKRQKLLAFEYGAKIYIDESFFSFGGGGFNTAVSLAKLGLKVAAVLAVGEDEKGREILDKLKEEKINTNLVQKQKNSPTSFSFIITSGVIKEHIIFSYQGASQRLKIEPKILKSRWIYLASLSSLNWQENINNLMKSTAEGVKLAWNPGQKQLKSGLKILKRYFFQTEVLILNKDEAIELVLSNEKKSQKINNIYYLLRTIGGWGPKILVITNAEKGAYIFKDKIKYYIPALSKKRVDTTGAGDAFNSSFIAGLILYNYDLRKALKLAAINSASVVAYPGAQNGLLSHMEAEKRMAKIKIKI